MLSSLPVLGIRIFYRTERRFQRNQLRTKKPLQETQTASIKSRDDSPKAQTYKPKFTQTELHSARYCAFPGKSIYRNAREHKKVKQQQQQQKEIEKRICQQKTHLTSRKENVFPPFFRGSMNCLLLPQAKKQTAVGAQRVDFIGGCSPPRRGRSSYPPTEGARGSHLYTERFKAFRTNKSEPPAILSSAARSAAQL